MRWLRWRREGQREHWEESERLETLNIASADRIPSVSRSTDTLQLLPKSPVGSWQVWHTQQAWRNSPNTLQLTRVVPKAWHTRHYGHITAQRGPVFTQASAGTGRGTDLAQRQLNKRDLWELGLLQVFLLQMDVNLPSSNQGMIYLGPADRERVTGNSWVLINMRQKSCGKCKTSLWVKFENVCHKTESSTSGPVFAINTNISVALKCYYR